MLRDSQQERNNQDALLKSLKEKIIELEERDKTLLTEIDRLEVILADRDNEIARLKEYQDVNKYLMRK